MMRPVHAAATVVIAASALLGCADTTLRSVAPESAPVLQGPAVASNGTPMDSAFTCYADRLLQTPNAALSIGVGEVRDFTGKSSINEGATITQGGSLMVMSALGKLRQAVRIHERFDPRVGELELIYTDRRQLGDGRAYNVPEGNRLRQVPWLPYMGGSILQSQYFIVGGITEVNWSVQSGGFSARVNGVGPRARNFTMNVAADLRIVNTRNLVVAHTVSLQKQVVGNELDVDVFRFFGNRLFDINAGTRNLEPIQLAVRVTLELAVLQLVSHVSGVSLEGCLDEAVKAGLVSGAYVPPQFPPAPEPVAVLPPITPPSAPPAEPNSRQRSRSEATPSDRRSATGRRSEANAAEPVAPVAAPMAPALRQLEGPAVNRQTRPDSVSRPQIPSYLEGPVAQPAAPRSLFAPGGNGAPRSTNGGSLMSPMPAQQLQPTPVPDHMLDGNSPTPGAPINILGTLVPLGPDGSSALAFGGGAETGEPRPA